MELQDKIEEIICSNKMKNLPKEINISLAAKECTKLYLQEQIKLLLKIASCEIHTKANFKYIEKLQQQLKELE